MARWTCPGGPPWTRTGGRALVEAVRLVPGGKHLVFEEGAQSAWLYEILSPHVSYGIRILAMFWLIERTAAFGSA